MPKVSEQHKAEVKERLVEAAFQTLRENGYEGATTRQILQRAGLSAGSLYHYFGGKRDLMAALAEQVSAGDIPRLLGASVEEVRRRPVKGTLLYALRRMLRPTSRSLLPYLRPRAINDAQTRKGLRAYDQRLVEVMSELNRRGQSDGLIRDDLDPEALVEVLELFFEGLKLRQLSQGFITSFDRVTRVFLSVFLAGISPEGSQELTAEAARRRSD